MTRARGAKPDLLRHEGLLDLEERTGLPMRLCYIALFMACDREGRFQWRPRTLRAELLPCDNIDMGKVLAALEEGDFVWRYTGADGKVYGWIPAFTRHQNINNKEPDSVLPPHPREEEYYAMYEEGARVDDASPTREAQDLGKEARVDDASPTREARVDDASPTREARDLGKEARDLGKGKERKRKGIGRGKARQGRAGPPQISALQQKAEEIVRAAPGSGDWDRAVATALAALQNGEDPAAMLAAAQTHKERYDRLMVEQQCYCPGLNGYFIGRRWRDDPDHPPWTLTGNGNLGSPSGEKKERPPPDEQEREMLAWAQDLWPNILRTVRWEDIPRDRRRMVEAHREQMLAKDKKIKRPPAKTKRTHEKRHHSGNEGVPA